MKPNISPKPPRRANVTVQITAKMSASKYEPVDVTVGITILDVNMNEFEKVWKETTALLKNKLDQEMTALAGKFCMYPDGPIARLYAEKAKDAYE